MHTYIDIKAGHHVQHVTPTMMNVAPRLPQTYALDTSETEEHKNRYVM